jgi:sulfate adenylyltransferase large subunit
MEARAATIEEFLEAHQRRELLRFTTAGSVDDGKSTLIGRLLYDSKGVYEDQLASVKNSRINRSTGAIDFSLLTDGLRAEREQGITIDVAYRYFSTPRRKFIIADTPGHEQYTRNMATGASTASLAVILVDARKGLLAQSRRHAYISWLLGIPRVVVAVNKMDLVGFREEIFDSIRADFDAFAARLGFLDVRAMPISALDGDNVVSRSERTPWYHGPSLLEHLETVPVDPGHEFEALRFPVQYVIRPDHDFRGFAGQLAGGVLRPGDAVMALPSGRTSRVKRIASRDGDASEAFPPMSITMTLEDEIDVSRGDMLVDPALMPHVSRRLEAMLVWMHPEPMLPGRPYVLKHTTRQVSCTVTSVLHRVNINTLAKEEAVALELNEIGAVAVDAQQPLFFDAYATNRATGGFILIDPLSNATVGAGMILARRVAPAIEDVEYDVTRVTPAERRARSGHAPATVWLTARKELAWLLERRLFEKGCQVHALADEADSQLMPELARILNAAGLIVICSIASDDAGGHERARGIVGPSRFIPVAPGDLSSDDGEAVEHILRMLERRGFLGGQFGRGGEGI